MNKTKEKFAKKARRKARVRARISGTKDVPRFSVYRSNSGLYLQLIDDANSKTLISAHSREVKASKQDKESEISGKTAIAFELGKLLAKKALEKKISKVVFDRGGNKYHGRVKAVADGAREGGLDF